MDPVDSHDYIRLDSFQRPHPRIAGKAYLFCEKMADVLIFEMFFAPLEGMSTNALTVARAGKNRGFHN
jgi:hypothetical protein